METGLKMHVIIIYKKDLKGEKQTEDLVKGKKKGSPSW